MVTLSPEDKRERRGEHVAYLAQSAAATFNPALKINEQVTESAVIGVPHPVKDEEVVAFCVLEDRTNVSEALRTELLTLVARELGKPLKPREIRFTEALPKTRNAKVMHRLIRAAYLDQPLGDLGSLEDPGTVDSVRAAK